MLIFLNLKTVFEDFISVFYPGVCAACENTLDKGEEVLCLDCRYSLPETNFHLYKGNPIEKLLWGKIKIEAAAAYCFFSRTGKIQKLIHNLKYHGHKKIGIFIGKEYGKILKQAEAYKNLDVIIPVPLFRRKERHRGYNQSEYFAKGLSETLNIPIDLKSLIRIRDTESQTMMKGYEKYLNVKGAFKVVSPDTSELINKHVLLVDDVITKGFTIVESAEALSVIEGIKISVAAIAYAGM